MNHALSSRRGTVVKALGLVLLAACGAPTPAVTAPIAIETPPADAAGPAPDAASLAWHCCEHDVAAPERRHTEVPLIPATERGEPSEAARQAKRLFDSERWAEAAAALNEVAMGETGDNRANVEIAEYHLAIAHFRLGHYSASATTFRKIARQRAHTRFVYSLLWLAKLVALPEAQGFVAPEDLASYEAAAVKRFDNPEQRDVYWATSFLLGMARLRAAEYREARALFAQVDEGSPYAADAHLCLRLLAVRDRG